jgi:hypothetical protein
MCYATRPHRRGYRPASACPKVAAHLGDTKEVVLATYAHFMPDDDDRARETMNAFFEEPGEASCATGVQRGLL